MRARKTVIRTPPSLIALVVRRIAVFAALAMLAQTAGIFVEYWFDDQATERLAIEVETEALAQGLSAREDRAAFSLPQDLVARYGAADSGYFVRVRTAAGAQLFSNCSGACEALFPPLAFRPLVFWMRQVQPGKPLQVAGGRVVAEAPEPVMIEIAVVEDRAGVIPQVFTREVVHHVLPPMGLMLVFVLGATVLSVMQMLRPVQRAARQVAALDPGAQAARLPTEGMPREIAGFADAVNSAFDRIGELMSSQRLLTSAISHEVRTPLAVARLELEKIADPRARKVEGDLEALNHLVEQLTSLARVEGAPLASMEQIDPAALAERVIGDLAPFVYASGKSIALDVRDASPFAGHPALIENALRNLVENAVRHTPEGAAIRVDVGPGAAFCVHDDGDRARNFRPADGVGGKPGRQGLGLRIVDRIAAVHRGRFEWTRIAGLGVAARIDFAPSP